ncbi:MAG: hypothetical protein R3C39_04485 [Dehalococcoidia bacterium]
MQRANLMIAGASAAAGALALLLTATAGAGALVFVLGVLLLANAFVRYQLAQRGRPQS